MPLVQLKAQGSVDGMEEKLQMEEEVLVGKKGELPQNHTFSVFN